MKALTQYKRQQGNLDREGNTDRQKTTFDLSHDHKTTFSMGQLIPFVTLPTLPGDLWELGAEFMSRFAPLYLPIMHRVELLMTWFYVPNRILWKSPSGWEEFLTGEEELDIPWLAQPVNPVTTDPDNTIIRYRIYEYMGFPTRTEELIGAVGKRVNLFPVAAYWAIYDQYFRNPQLQEEKFVPLVAGENTDYDTDELQRVTYKLWNRDYLTMALPEPQMGEEILVPMVNPDFDTITAGIDPGDIGGPYRWMKYDSHAPSDDGELAVSSSITGQAGGTAIVGEDAVYLNVQETAATIRQFRIAARLQEYLEQLMRSGQRYSDFMQSFFGENPDAGVIQVPQWIGGQKGNVVISEVLSTAETETIPLGGYAGQMLSVDSTQKFKYYCKEHGWIIGILAITPRTSYMQGISRHYTRLTPLDYPWSHFEDVGDQAVKTKEVFFYMTDDVTADNADNEQDFAYVPRYQEWKTQNDIVSGQMRTIWSSFHMARIFAPTSMTGQPPILNSDFVSCYNPRIADVFQLAAAQDHEIYAHIWNHAVVRRQLKRYGIPKL